MTKEDYKITIQFDKNGELYWEVYKQGEPHYIGNNSEELQLVYDAVDKLKFYINRLLRQNETNKYQ